LASTAAVAIGAVVTHLFSGVARHASAPAFRPALNRAGPGEADGPGAAAYLWASRLTYPERWYSPAWVRRAVAQDARVPRVARPRFVSLGPRPEHMEGCAPCYSYTTTEGRINALAVDPTTTTNGKIVAYAGSDGGGVWKTRNCCTAATRWAVLTDSPLIADISIGSVAIDPNHHQTIYAGTGDANGALAFGSQGILKSTDGGAHWKVLGAEVFAPAYPQPAGEFPQFDAVGKVRVDPNESDNVVAGTKRGLFFSYDGGARWTGPCLTTTFATQRQDITGLELTRLGGATRILAAVGASGLAELAPLEYDIQQNGANGIYEATMPTAGCPSFTSIAGNSSGFVYGSSVPGSPYADGAPMNAASGAPFGPAGTGNQLGRIDIAVAPSDPSVIYAQVQSVAPNADAGCELVPERPGQGCQLGAWVTVDGGASWEFMAGSAGGSLRSCATTGPGSGQAGSGDFPQNWYDQGVAVDPRDPDRVFFDTFEVWLANRTGSEWYDLTCAYTGANPHPVHPDQHALAFVPGSSRVLLLGDDGGIHGTREADVAELDSVRPRWFNMDRGLNTIEFYSGDTSGNFLHSGRPSAIGAAQDNGVSVVSFRGRPKGPVRWQSTVGGDGFYARIDPVGNGSSLRYWADTDGARLWRCGIDCLSSGAHWQSGYSTLVMPWANDTTAFVAPFDLFHGGIAGGDDCAPARPGGGCGHLLLGTTRVWETVSGGKADVNWHVSNDPESQNMTKQTLGSQSFINQVKYSPKYRTVAMAGTNDGNAWIGFGLGTARGGEADWVDVTGANTLLPNRPVVGIALDPKGSRDAPVGYAAVGGFDGNTPATPGHLFRVTCSARCRSFAWADKTGNLPDIPADSVVVNPRFPRQVFVGTDFGLYVTNDVRAAVPKWLRLANGMPSAMIWDLRVDRGSTALSAWTRSRGAYVMPLPAGAVAPR
jgi:hypothetical protein